MKYNKAKWQITLACAGLLFAGVSCQDKFDETTLKEAGKDVYMTITPADPSIAVGRDTLEMTCKVESMSGDLVTDAEITWSSEDENIARFIDGTNRLVGVRQGAGKTVRVRATLPNGRYATTNITVLKNVFSELGLFLNEKTLAGERLYLSPGGTLEFLAVVNPPYLLRDNTVSWDMGDSGISIEPIELKPKEGEDKRDQDRIDKLPEGGTWYKLSAGQAQIGEYTIHLRVGEVSQPVQVKVGPSLVATPNNVGELLYAFAFDNKEFKDQERSSVMNIKSRATVVAYAQMIPATQDAFDQIKEEVKWSIDGAAGIIESTTAEFDGDLFKFVANVMSGASVGSFKVSCTLHEKVVAQTITVKDYVKEPFESLLFLPETITDLSVGEKRRVRVRVLPRASTGVIISELIEAIKKDGIGSVVAYSTPGVLEVEEKDGDFSLKGLSTGKTDIIFTVRGQQFVWKDIQTIPTPRSLLIDNTTPNVVMVGDEVDWNVKLVMEGTDAPDWGRVVWSIVEGNSVSFAGKPSGERVRLRAVAQLPEGKTELTTNIKAQYGKSDKIHTREIKVVPLQKDVTLASALYDIPQSGVSPRKGEVILKQQDTSRGDLPVSINIGAQPLEEKTYDAAAVPVFVGWVNGLKKQAKSGTIAVQKVGTKYNIVLDLVLQVGDHKISVKGSVEGLQRL